MIFHNITKFLPITLGAIALSTAVSACSGTTTETPTPSTTPKMMDHGGMGKPDNASGMKHTGMQSGGMGHSMDLGPADADYDLRFIDAMIPHHEGAVVMAKDMAAKTKRPEMKKLAQAILKAQPQEIAQMQQWRKDWYPKAPATPMAWHSGMKHMMTMEPAQMKAMKMDMDLGKADEGYDLRFIQAMIPHHEAAVTMAKDLAQKTKRPALQKLAKDIIASQQVEIDQMKQWQKAWTKP
jgi:uncharacterized protein (DUF305 family)